RHYFDVWRLIQSGVAARAAADTALFAQVAAHRQLFFRYGWMNYDTLKCGTIQVVPQPEQIDEWRRDYAAMHGEMFLATPPAFDEILATITVFQADFNKS
ncbi:MAG TPA: nucleotidyl transferase AbiEii/AbiGii toxin family protein, partial [Gemmatimonadaceae bacterium]